ncbi:MAG: tetratricopeptide repeat protein [Candidatus Azobacteroides sp.]|nr:tetratricopeptide repeat protein [Candidatus Azobacteroides sp.]
MRIASLSVFLLLFSISLFADEVEKLINQSFDCIEEGDYDCAEDALKAVLRQDPANPRNGLLLANLSNVQLSQGKKEEAMLTLHAAINSLPQVPFLRITRATLYMQIDSIDAALEDYQEVLKIDPFNEDALYSAGLIYLQTEDTLSAKKYFDTLLEKDPASTKGRAGYGALLLKAENYSTAETIFTDILSKDPEYYFVYMQRAIANFMLNKNAKALEDVNKYLSKYPHDEHAYFLRGKIKLSQWEKKSAYEDFQHAKRLGYDEKEISKMIDNIK